jgi:hypothetical protein
MSRAGHIALKPRRPWPPSKFPEYERRYHRIWISYMGIFARCNRRLEMEESSLIEATDVRARQRCKNCDWDDVNDQ